MAYPRNPCPGLDEIDPFSELIKADDIGCVGDEFDKALMS
jgi:hypothetical protein